MPPWYFGAVRLVHVLLPIVCSGVSCRAPSGVTVAAAAGDARTGACFLLLDPASMAELRRGPGDICRTRVSPASTFKIPHALVALDSGVLAPPDTMLTWDGTPHELETWRRNHTLGSALRDSVVWYFQRVAERLGQKREREYLAAFGYGNRDTSGELTTFWLDGSLLISPEEQLRFLARLYRGELPIKPEAMRTVREALVQPDGVVHSALGARPFSAPWPPGTVLSAKTGSTRGADGRDGREVRWLVGHVARGDARWVFVACIAAEAPLPAGAALDLAAAELRRAGVL